MDLTNARAWVDCGNGWEELAGVTHIAIDEQHQPIDLSACPGYNPPDWIEGYGTGEVRGLLPWLRRVHEPTPAELALAILRPYLALCPLYRGV